jgi:mannose-1-phosphate guanylyltransferase/mannose-6-phosphate isomerase
MLVMPADHAIGDLASFDAAIAHGLAAAQAGRLVTFGIEPTRPETGYGYIRRGTPLDALPRCFALDRFVEKPPLATAEEFLAAGDHFWNSGIFLFPVERFHHELSKFAPDVVTACEAALSDCERDGGFVRLGTAFRSAPSCAIDTAVMERVADAAVVPVAMGWSDVGSWAALWEVSPRDAAGNATSGEVVAVDVHDSLLRSDGPALSVVGLRDIVLVATRDAVLAMAKGRSEDVRGLVQRFDATPGERMHTVVQHAWGTSELTDRGAGFAVRRLVVYPGGEVSVPPGHDRDVHWVVVQGSASVSRDGRTLDLAAGASSAAGHGACQVGNAGPAPLVLVEVRRG